MSAGAAGAVAVLLRRRRYGGGGGFPPRPPSLFGFPWEEPPEEGPGDPKDLEAVTREVERLDGFLYRSSTSERRVEFRTEEAAKDFMRWLSARGWKHEGRIELSPLEWSQRKYQMEFRIGP